MSVLAPPPTKKRFQSVLFGDLVPVLPGQATDWSATEIRVVTDRPLNEGAWIKVVFNAETESLTLEGQVEQSDPHPKRGAMPGMTIKIINPPIEYLRFVRRQS